MPSRLILFVLTSALALICALHTLAPSQAVQVVGKAGYWIILGATVTFAVAFAKSLVGCAEQFRAWRRWLAPAMLVLAGGVLLNVHERHEYKIVADEIVLGLTAKQLHFSREAIVTVRGYEYAGDYLSLASYVDKRPLFFPFLVATLHDLTGFRTGNVFLLNGALSFVLLGLLLLIGRRFDGWSAGAAGVLLLITIPLVAQNVCGAGFELLNMVMILLTIWLAMRSAERPESNDRLSAFVLSTVLLTQVRYESVVFVLPAAAMVIYVWRKARTIRLPWPLLVSPVFMALSPLQYNVFKLSEATWQLNDVAGADRVFGLRYFYDNVGHALSFFLTTDGSQPNSILVAVLGILSVGFFVLWLYRFHREIFTSNPGNAAICIFIIGLSVHTLLMLCYFWGRWDDPIIRRLSLPAHLLFVLATILVWPQLVSGSRRWQILMAMAAAYLVSFTIPSNAMHKFTQQNFASRTANWIDSYIRRLDADQPALAIDRNAGLLWILHGKSSVTSQAIAARPEAFALHFRNNSFKHYFLVQRMTPDIKTGGRIVDASDDFGDAMTLETVDEKAFAPLYLVRLSKIVAVNEEKLIAWSKARKHQKLVDAPAASAPGGNYEDQLLLWFRQLP